jgi:hypothetical protein
LAIHRVGADVEVGTSAVGGCGVAVIIAAVVVGTAVDVDGGEASIVGMASWVPFSMEQATIANSSVTRKADWRDR